MSPEQLETWPVADDATCRAWRMLWGLRLLDALRERDADAFCDADAARMEWEA